MSLHCLNMAALIEHNVLESFKEINLTEGVVKLICIIHQKQERFFSPNSSRKVLGWNSGSFSYCVPIPEPTNGDGALSLPGL